MTLVPKIEVVAWSTDEEPGAFGVGTVPRRYRALFTMEGLAEMSPMRSTVLFLLAVAALGGVGYSATGSNFILGSGNSASKRTALQASVGGPVLRLENTAGGTALALVTGESQPPFSVSSRQRVDRLNADSVDSFHARDLTRARQASRDEIQLLHSGGATLGKVDIIAPRKGAVFVTAQAVGLLSSSGAVRFDLQVRHVQGDSLSPFAITTLSGPSAYGTVSVNYMFQVSRGKQTFELNAGWYFLSGSTNPLIRNPTINAFFVPFAGDKAISPTAAAQSELTRLPPGESLP